MTARPCAGGCGLAAEPGDTFCAGCRSALDRGSDPSDWPELELEADKPRDAGDAVPASRAANERKDTP